MQPKEKGLDLFSIRGKGSEEVMADGISLKFGVPDAFHMVLSRSHQVPIGYLLCSQFVPQVPISNTHYLICFAQTPSLVHCVGCSKEKTRWHYV